MSFGDFRYGAQVTFVKKTDVTFSVWFELSQPIGKKEFSTSAKTRTNSVRRKIRKVRKVKAAAKYAAII